MKIWIDIETIPLPSSKREWARPRDEDVKMGNIKDPKKREEKILAAHEAWSLGTKAALDPLQGQVALICALDEVSGEVEAYHGPEGAMLEKFWAMVGGKTVIGHNIRFDATFLVVRSWALGVPVSKHMVQDLYSYKPDYWQDTMELFRLGDRGAAMRSLDDIYHGMGLKSEPSPVTGKDFWKWWEKDKETAIEYCKQDVLKCKAIYKRMQS